MVDPARSLHFLAFGNGSHPEAKCFGGHGIQPPVNLAKTHASSDRDLAFHKVGASYLRADGTAVTTLEKSRIAPSFAALLTTDMQRKRDQESRDYYRGITLEEYED